MNNLVMNDRGLSFGDGFFTTMAVVRGEIQLFEAHFDRITTTSTALGIEPLPLDAITTELRQRGQRVQNGGLKLIVTRGVGGQGYQVPAEPEPSWILSEFNLPAIYVRQRKEGIKLGVSPIRLAAGHCYSQYKTLNRLEQVAIKRELANTADDDHICLDIFGQLAEASAANIFWRQGSHIYTPDLALAGINGIMRQHVLALLKTSGRQVHTGSYSLGALERADEIFLTNSLMPILPVRQFEQRTLNDFSTANALLNELELSL